MEKPFGPLQRLAAWVAAVVLIGMLGMVRSSTDAEFAFASAAIIPVLLVAWTCGFRDGATISVLAAGMWVVADIQSGRQFSSDWVPVLNGCTRLATYVFVAYLAARVRTLLAREAELATHDMLTGLLNRRALLVAGEAEASRARRYGHSLTVVFIDLDDFKQLNDTHGHDAGDAALRATAGALRKSLRVSDKVGRFGGDEFAILLPEIGEAAAAEAGRKLVDTITAALAPFPPVSASIGIAWFDSAQADFPAMLKAADALMYEIKQEGKCGMRMRSFASPSPASSQ